MIVPSMLDYLFILLVICLPKWITFCVIILTFIILSLNQISNHQLDKRDVSSHQ